VIKKAVSVFYRAAVQFSTKGGWIMSSYVAMSAMLALFPFILFVVSLAGAASHPLVVDDLIALIFGAWPEAIADPIEVEIRAVIASSSQNLITIGGVMAIVFASNGTNAVREAMSRAYRESDPRPFWKQRLISLIFVIVGAVAVLVFISVGLALPVYLEYANAVTPDLYNALFKNEFPLLLLTGVLVLVGVTSCHLWLPYGAHPFRKIWPGVLVTIGLWIAAANGFSIYITKFASYSVTYAGLAGAMGTLIFLNLMSAILIFGAEFNNALAEVYEADTVKVIT
jgi:membrane protein